MQKKKKENTGNPSIWQNEMNARFRETIFNTVPKVLYVYENSLFQALWFKVESTASRP